MLPAAEALEHFCPRAAHLDYLERRPEWRSIGSGMVEGACKQVIDRRPK